jgi:hypothetical protein
MVSKRNCYSRVTLVDPWFAGRILMENGKLLASFHGVQNVDIQKDQESTSMYHITENGLMIALKNVGLINEPGSLGLTKLAISLKIRWIKSRIQCIGFLGRLIFGPSKHLMGILGMDFDRILRGF